MLVNNAGITRDGLFRKMSVDDWRAVIDTNLNSLFNVTKQVLDGMVERQWGRIVNISSVNGQKGQFGQTNYSTAKAGIHGFTMALAQEVASKGHYRQHHFAGLHRDRHGAGHPSRRAGENRRDDSGAPAGYAEEIASMTSWLASDESGFCHGRGFLAQWRPAHGLRPHSEGPGSGGSGRPVLHVK